MDLRIPRDHAVVEELAPVTTGDPLAERRHLAASAFSTMAVPVGLAYVTGAGIVAALSAVFGPAPDSHPRPQLLLASVAIVLVWAATKFVPMQGARVTLALCLGALLVAGTMATAGSAMAPFHSMSFVLVGLATTVLFPGWEAGLVLGVVALADGAALAAQPGLKAQFTDWLLTCGAVAMTVAIIASLMQEMEEQVRRERRARTRLDIDRAALAEASARKSAFVARMSHDLRTPLNAIVGYADALATGLAGPLSPTQSDYVDDISASGGHLLALVGGVLNLSGIERGTTVLELGEVDVEDLLYTTVPLFRELAGRREQHFRLDIAPGARTVRADARRVRQMVVNLLSNAVKFTDPGGHIGLTVRRDGSWMLFEVTDDGPGIAAVDQERIFEKFGRSAALDETGGRTGTGLGVTHARDDAPLHGGVQRVESVEGVGSTFQIRLPLEGSSRPKLEQEPGPQRKVAQERKTRIPSRSELWVTLASFALYPIALLTVPASIRPQVDVPLLTLVVSAAFLIRLTAWRLGKHQRLKMRLEIYGSATLVMLAAEAAGPEIGPFILLFLLWLTAFAAMTLDRRGLAGLVGVIAVGTAMLFGLQAGHPLPAAAWCSVLSATAVFAFAVRGIGGRLRLVAREEQRARRTALATNRQLERATRHKTEFLAGMTHELRAPLNVIIGAAEALEDGLFGPLLDVQADYAHEIGSAGRELLHLIDDALDLARLEAGRMPTEPVLTSVRSLVAPLRARWAESAADADVQLEINAPAPDEVVHLDPNRADRAVGALVRHALAHTAAGDKVTVEVTVEVGWLSVAVTDASTTAIGDDRVDVFEPFAGTDGTTRHGIATGLELALADALARLLGGSVSVGSTPGSGNRFVLALPVQEPVPPTVAVTAERSSTTDPSQPPAARSAAGIPSATVTP